MTGPQDTSVSSDYIHFLQSLCQFEEVYREGDVGGVGSETVTRPRVKCVQNCNRTGPREICSSLIGAVRNHKSLREWLVPLM